jgi:shikimate dehydrogenase
MSAKLAGVVGWPIAHSLSPKLHAHWLAELGIDGFYVPLAVQREDFARVVDALRLAGFAGVNVTVPHKEAAFALAHSTDEAARAAGAANLLVFGKDGAIAARNTDSAGLQASLVEELGKDAIRGRDAVLLGAGGAARAAVLALDAMGAREIRIINRNAVRADAIAAALRPVTESFLSAGTSWPAAASGAALLVNATSAGMKGAEKLAIDLAPLPAAAAVCDLVYNPSETDLIKAAKGRGLRTVGGLGMLMHQAVPAFEAFFGQKPRVTPALRRELEAALA